MDENWGIGLGNWNLSKSFNKLHFQVANWYQFIGYGIAFEKLFGCNCPPFCSLFMVLQSERWLKKHEVKECVGYWRIIYIGCAAINWWKLDLFKWSMINYFCCSAHIMLNRYVLNTERIVLKLVLLALFHIEIKQIWSTANLLLFFPFTLSCMS